VGGGATSGVGQARRLQIAVSGEPVRKAVYLLALAALAVAGCHLDTLLSGGSGGGAPPRVATGTLRAAAVTSGSNPPAGYTMTLDSSQPTSIGINDSVIATGIPAGSHRAALGSVPDNCNVSGDNPRTVSVRANETARTTFSVACNRLATRLAFNIEPPQLPIVLGQNFTVEVSAEDDSGNLAPAFADSVAIAIANDGSLTKDAHLSGTRRVKAVNGLATFNDLRIDKTGVNYTLKATAAQLADATSRPFDVVTAAP